MIVCVGEILADMIGEEKNGSITYEQKAGGAPFNVACAAKLFGAKVAFVGSVGDDIIGKSLVSFAKKRGFDRLYIDENENRNTTLAFVALDSHGERSFCFFRKNTADAYIKNPSATLLKTANIIHIGSLMTSEKRGVRFIQKLAERAKRRNVKISFDVNFRSDIFKNEREAVKTYKQILPLADIIKFSEDETEIFGARYIERELKDKLVFVTLGSKGSRWAWKDRSGYAPTVKVKCVDTTGAGDAFYAGVLYKLDQADMSTITDDELNEILRFANVCGALNTLGKGAIDCLPTIEQIQTRLNGSQD
ncbi:MAG: carbohydrate kinase [Clostridia bacterium]|nr:carbohydrate kinase [Clostridia bacterium]